MGRYARRDEKHRVEATRETSRLCRVQVAVVDRVERSAEHADPSLELHFPGTLSGRTAAGVLAATTAFQMASCRMVRPSPVAAEIG